MLLLVDNRQNLKDTVSFTPKVKKALKQLGIPFHCFQSKTEEVESIPHPELFQGIILGGSLVKLSQNPDHLFAAKNRQILKKFPNLPVLGLCFGCQILAVHHGNSLVDLKDYYSEKKEIQTVDHLLFEEWKNPKIGVFRFSDYVMLKPHTRQKKIAWFTENNKKVACGFQYNAYHYGLLFHPEADPSSYPIFKQFAKRCGMSL